MAQWKQIQLGAMRLWVLSLAFFSGLRILHYHELWCSSQMQLRSCGAVAVVLAGSCSSDQTPSLGTSTCCRCSPQKDKKEKKRKYPKTLTILLDFLFLHHVMLLNQCFHERTRPEASSSAILMTSCVFLLIIFFNSYFPNLFFFYCTAWGPSDTYMYTFYFLP